MLILLLSDVHSNFEALTACMEAAPPCDRVVNLGDVVGYGGSPNEVTELCRKNTWVCVRGNHDKVCTGIESAEYFNPIAALAAYWTRQKLTPENFAWLRAMPEGPVRSDELKGVQFVHGSPLDEDEYMISLMDATEALDEVDVPVTFFGHSHIQGAFFLDNGDDPKELRPGNRHEDDHETHRVQLVAGARYMINPGSVGQPRDGDWRAAFAVFDTEKRELTFHRVPYDVEAAQKHIRDAQLPERLAARLGEGR